MPPISPVIMFAKRCMMNDVGAFNFTTTVLLSVAVTDMIGAVGLTELALAALLFRACPTYRVQLCATSCASSTRPLTGATLWNFTPGRILNVNVVLSGENSQDCARLGSTS